MKIALAARLAAVVIALAATSAFAETDGSIAGGNSGDENHYILECGGVCQANLVGGAITPSFTGAWFDPAQSGHGLFIEILPGNKIQAAWFTFSPTGEQAWFLGVGSYVDNSATISAVEPVGGRWIPNFDPRQIVNNAWGTLTLTFTDADHGRVDFSSALGFGAGSMNLARLTKVAVANVNDPSIAAKWVAASPLSVARAWHTATLLLDDRVLVVGGSGDLTAELYDPVTDTWRGAANMSAADSGPATATLLRDGKVLIVGGSHVELYDPVSNTWTDGPNTDGANTTTLLEDGRVLITTGERDDFGGFLYAFGKLYDPAAGKWTFTSRPSDPGTTATLLHNGKVLVVGLSSSSQIYDPVTDIWDPVGGPEFAYGAYAALTLADGSVMVVGEDGVWVFDAAMSAWARIADLNIPRRLASATLLPGGNVLVVGGWSCSTDACIEVASTELYDVHARQWRFAGDLIRARADHAATLLRDGRVLIEGGVRTVPGRKAPIALASAELYPAPGTIGAGFTGSWYDPAQSGHGLFVEVLPDNAFLAAWFTFDPAGTAQSWFLGVGTYAGNSAAISNVVRPTGGRWIPNFDPSHVVNNPWGSLTFTFTDCVHGKVEFASSAGYGVGSMNLTRLTQPAGLTCP